MTQHELGTSAPPAPRDRGAVDLSAQYRPPGTDLQRELAALWQERLAVHPIGLDDDFFELGGHSLLAAELLAEVRRRSGAQVSATSLFLDPTIADLARAVEQARAGAPGVSTCDNHS